ncbi:general substrate transporter [Aureobasidium subglaciale]|nr:general substrate transporter [Aureobasidium subglaciale]
MAAGQVKSTAGNLEPPAPAGKVTLMACSMGLVASIGGFMFGYASGQISGIAASSSRMSDYLQRFGQQNADGTYNFGAYRQGTITALLCAGAAVGSLIAGRLADVIGRKFCISLFAFWTAIGVIVEISSSTSWSQFAAGRFIDGIGIGALSVVVPMYQGESAPRVIRGVLIACYQLFITLGIWTSYMIDYGTHNTYSNSAQWRIPNGISFLWAFILGVGILFLPESPRFAYRAGREDEARNVIARYAGVNPDDKEVNDEINDIRAKLDGERNTVGVKWHGFFTGPRMAYRTILGMTLQAGQQLTGANFFFYYGTTIFKATGLKDSYVTQIILGTVNVVCTFGGLYVVAKCGRRKALIVGALWAFICFMIYAFVGHFKLPPFADHNDSAAGSVLIVFTCLFIVSFATTWGPLVWAVVAELYPANYRASCMGLATASNWIWNFLISLFSTVIVDEIHWFFGLVFGGCCLGLAAIVYFFVIESKDRSLEEIDTMYVLHINPITSSRWVGSKVSTDAYASDMAEQGNLL